MHIHKGWNPQSAAEGWIGLHTVHYHTHLERCFAICVKAMLQLAREDVKMSLLTGSLFKEGLNNTSTVGS